MALAQAAELARRNDIEWLLRPVVYAKLLEATGLSEPAEVAVKRSYTFVDIQRCARLAGVPLEGPPTHPFRSLEALRLATLYRDHEQGLALSVALAGAAWGEGRDLTDLAVLEELRADCDLEGPPLAEALSTDAARASLRDATDEAAQAGVFGVPSFLVAGELFWGHDRMEQLGLFLHGELPSLKAEADRLLSRPLGVQRRGAPR